MTKVDCAIQLDVICEGFDRKTGWFAPRIGVIPPSTAVLLMTRATIGASDVGDSTYSMRSNDMGKTWSKPAVEPNLGLIPYDGGRFYIFPWDMVPAWHAASGKLLALGCTNSFVPGGKTPAFGKDAPPIRTCYSVYDATAQNWSRWQSMEFTDNDHFYKVHGGAAQRFDLPNGDILWPVYCLDRQSGSEAWYAKSCFFATIVRCRFDGQAMKYLEHGDELTVADPRGLCEPSLTRFGKKFYLTLRNDVRGYVTTSDDGLHFAPITPWRFDDGSELGSYNTQQHWVTHSDGLFLTYTRRGASNDHVIRHRAPVFLAQVDPKRLCVIRDTEQILMPDKGAQFGNGGALEASPQESWVLDAEGMHGDAEKPFDIERTIRRGANNRVYLCRIIWNTINQKSKLC